MTDTRRDATAALVLGLLVALLARNADAQPEANLTANYMVPMCHLDKHRIVGGTNYSLKCKPTQRMF